MINPCNPIEQQARADYIEALYQALVVPMAFTPTYIKNASPHW